MAARAAPAATAASQSAVMRAFCTGWAIAPTSVDLSIGGPTRSRGTTTRRTTMENYLRTLTTFIVRARQIKKSLGTRVAAGFLRNRGVSLNVALHILTRSY